jgi:hypothetical protein
MKYYYSKPRDKGQILVTKRLKLRFRTSAILNSVLFARGEKRRNEYMK